jgi:subtilisin-like proprotein convertase family protein
LTCGESGLIKNIEVAVDITHSYIGDLAVTLISPGGTTISLHQRRGGSQDNLIQTFTATTTPALQALQDQPLQGDWRLRAADLAGLDVGKLNRWSVKIAKK